jgi:hypothetical protein
MINYDNITKVKFKNYIIDNKRNKQIIDQLNVFAAKCFKKNIYFFITGSLSTILFYKKMFRNIQDIDLFINCNNFECIDEIISILNKMGYELIRGTVDNFKQNRVLYASNNIENCIDNFDTATTYILDGEKFYINSKNTKNQKSLEEWVYHDPNQKNSIGFNQIEKGGDVFRIWFKNTIKGSAEYRAFIYYKNNNEFSTAKANFTYNEQKNIGDNDWWSSELLPIDLLSSKFEYKIKVEKFHSDLLFQNKHLNIKFEIHKCKNLSSSDFFDSGSKEFGAVIPSAGFSFKRRFKRQKDLDDFEFFLSGQ